jgi:hypothetical protein
MEGGEGAKGGVITGTIEMGKNGSRINAGKKLEKTIKMGKTCSAWPRSFFFTSAAAAT